MTQKEALLLLQEFNKFHIGGSIFEDDAFRDAYILLLEDKTEIYSLKQGVQYLAEKEISYRIGTHT